MGWSTIRKHSIIMASSLSFQEKVFSQHALKSKHMLQSLGASQKEWKKIWQVFHSNSL